MAFRTPRDEREWRAMVERGLREARSGIRPLVNAAVDVAIGDVVTDIEGNSSQHPTAPIELTYQTALYLDTQGRTRVRFMLDFPDVTKDTEANDIEIEQYELWGKPVSAQLLALTTDAVAGLAAPGATLPGLAATPANKAIAAIERPWRLMAASEGSFFRAEDFIPGTLWDFRARAIGRGMATPGNWSIVVQVQMLSDITPPSQPTPPVLTVQRGTITATWDGQAVTGAMPADFQYAILAHGTDTSPTFEIARFGRGGGFKVVANIPYYDPQFFRLKAVDESGNESPWSEQAFGYTTPLVDTDIILSTIDAAQTHLKNINAGVSILPNTIITEHLVVTEEMTAALANFLHIKAGMLEANEIWADEAWFGVADAILVRSDMFEGKAFEGGTFTTTYGGKFQTNVEDLVGIKLDSLGMKAWSASGVNTFDLDALTGDLSIFGGTFTGATFQTSALANTGIKWDSTGIKAYNASATQAFSLSSTTGRGTFTGRIRTGLNSPGVTLLPAEESSTEVTTGMFISPTSTLTGQVTAGVWISDASSAGAEPLFLRGMNNAGVIVERGDFVVQEHPTTSSGANAVIAITPTYGMLYRSTSSLDYKMDVQEWDPAYRVLGLETYSWVDRSPMDPAEPLKRYFGLTAEQTSTVMPELVTLNGFGEPDAVQYDRVGPALIPVVRDLLRRIEILEGA